MEDIFDEYAKDSENSSKYQTDEAKDTSQQLANEAESANEEGKNVVLNKGGYKAEGEFDEFNDDLVIDEIRPGK